MKRLQQCVWVVTTCALAQTAFAQTAPVTSESVTAPPSAVTATVTTPVIDPMQTRDVHRACEGVLAPDAFAWTMGAIYMSTGVGLMVGTSFVPATSRDTGITFLGALGPGLILGGAGVPIGRGVFSGGEPLRVMCRQLQATRGREDAFEVQMTDRLLRMAGGPLSPVPFIALGVVSAGVISGTVVAFVLQSKDLASGMGGLWAAGLTTWLLFIPTPMSSNAVGYRSAHPLAHMAPVLVPTADGMMAGVAGAF